MEETNNQNLNVGQVQNYQTSSIANNPNMTSGQTINNQQSTQQVFGGQGASTQDVSAMYYEKKFMIAYLEGKQELHKVFSKSQFERFTLKHTKSTPDQLLADYVKSYRLVLEKYFKQVGVQNIQQQIDQVIIGFVKKYNKDFIAYATEEN